VALSNPLSKKSPTVDPRKLGSVNAALRRSLRAAVTRDWLGAETWLERIVEADSGDLDAYSALARLYREQGAMGRAIRMHQNLLLRSDLDRTQRLDALLELARDFDAGGFQERAIAGYEEVLDSQPKNQEALKRLVVLLHDQHDYPRGLFLTKRLRRFDRGVADEAEKALLLSQAQAQHSQGDQDGARTSLKRCLRRNKSCGVAWALLGELEVERGKDARALDAWRRGVVADPSMGQELLPKVAAGYAAKGKPQDFEKWVRALLEDRPTDSIARIALARAVASRGDTVAAVEELARAVEVSPSDPALRIELGRQLLAEGQESEAIKAYSGLLDALERGDFPATVREESEA
jgi:lipopolysaccharide assembly protein B